MGHNDLNRATLDELRKKFPSIDTECSAKDYKKKKKKKYAEIDTVLASENVRELMTEAGKYEDYESFLVSKGFDGPFTVDSSKTSERVVFFRKNEVVVKVTEVLHPNGSASYEVFKLTPGSPYISGTIKSDIPHKYKSYANTDEMSPTQQLSAIYPETLKQLERSLKGN